jgi:hypothetical protein
MAPEAEYGRKSRRAVGGSVMAMHSDDREREV